MLSFLSRIWRRFSNTSGYASPASWLVDALGGGRTSAGVSINAKTALNISSVYQALNLISSDIAKFPCIIYKRVDGGKERATSHPAYYLVKQKPSDELNSQQFFQTLVYHSLLFGNGYAYIARQGVRPKELVVLDPTCTHPIRIDGQLWYTTRVGQETRKIRNTDMLHIRGMSFDGIQGYGVLDVAKESFGLAAAQERFGARFFGSGSMASGILKVSGKLDDDRSKLIRNNWNALHEGLDRSHRIAVFEAGTDFQQLSIAPEQAQFLQSRKFSRSEIASWFNLPPHKLGDDSKASFSSLEQENRSYLTSTLEPWLTRIEREIWDKLLTEREKRNDEYVVEFLRIAILMSDAKTRHDIYRQMIDIGVYSRNEVRSWENLNAIDGGDEYLIAKNMGPADATESPAAEEADPPAAEDAADSEADSEKLKALRGLLVSTLDRTLKWEVDGLVSASKKPNFINAVDAFYAKHTTKMAEAIQPVADCLGVFGVNLVVEDLVRDYAEESKLVVLDIAGVASVESLPELLQAKLAEWTASRATETATSAIEEAVARQNTSKEKSE